MSAPKDDGYGSYASPALMKPRQPARPTASMASLETVVIPSGSSRPSVSGPLSHAALDEDLCSQKLSTLDAENATFVDSRVLSSLDASLPSPPIFQTAAPSSSSLPPYAFHRDASIGLLPGSEAGDADTIVPAPTRPPPPPPCAPTTMPPKCTGGAYAASPSNASFDDDLSSAMLRSMHMAAPLVSSTTDASDARALPKPCAPGPRKALGWSARLSGLAGPLNLVHTFRQQFHHAAHPPVDGSAAAHAAGQPAPISMAVPTQPAHIPTKSPQQWRRLIHGNNRVAPPINDKLKLQIDAPADKPSARDQAGAPTPTPTPTPAAQEEVTLLSVEDVDDDYSGSKSNNAKRVKCPAFDAKYKTIRKLGSGGHSTVRLAHLVSDASTNVVCKFIRASSVWHWHRPSPTRPKIPLEIHVMRQLAASQYPPHPAIVRYIEHFEYQSRYIITMESLGDDWVDLYDYVEAHGPVREDWARDIFRQIVDAIEFVHSLGYCHNDVKDENIMINTKTRHVKIIDFGSATPLTPGQTASLFYGTKKFAAPEAIQGLPYYPEAQEVWALGALLYVLLFKMDPFRGDREIIDMDIGRRIERLRQLAISSNGADGTAISDAAAAACKAMLHKDWSKRVRIRDIKKLAFLNTESHGRRHSDKHVPTLESLDEDDEWEM
ncbi:hypothetical protein SeMB42_g02998 [Synchytrium endobioticum]|nr:hypothetical protein SeMB42_g03002 [Synchytrium endobioticum]TPX48426.1 hypothetical protein SeMB42_g03006 [Synchytrium endobioticum]TPX48431.1 hypothetical protein SeMB42_g02998 [Synchytrium endobioticum]